MIKCDEVSATSLWKAVPYGVQCPLCYCSVKHTTRDNTGQHNAVLMTYEAHRCAATAAAAAAVKTFHVFDENSI